MVIGNSNLYRIVLFRDLVARAVISLLDEFPYKVDGQEISYDLGSNTQKICSLIHRYLRRDHVRTSAIDTLVLGTCEPRANSFPLYTGARDKLPYDDSLWYGLKDENIKLNLPLLNYCMKIVFYDYFYDSKIVAKDFKSRNIRFIYCYNYSAMTLLACTLKKILNVKNCSVDIDEHSFLVDYNDITKVKYDSLVFPREDIKLLEKFVFKT